MNSLQSTRVIFSALLLLPFAVQAMDQVVIEAPPSSEAEASRVPALTHCALPKFFEWCNKNNIDATKQPEVIKEKLIDLIKESSWAAKFFEPVIIPVREIESAAFSADSRKVLITSCVPDAEFVDLIDAKTGSLDFAIEHKGLQCTALSPDMSRILTASSVVNLRRTKNIEPLGVYKQKIPVNWVGFSPDSKIAAYATTGGLFLINAQTGAEIAKIKERTQSVQFSPDSSKILTISNTFNFFTVRVIDTQNGKYISHIYHESEITTASFSSDSRKVITGSAKGEIKVFDVMENKVLLNGEKYGHITFAQFTPDMKKIVIITQDQNNKIWIMDAKTGHTIAMCPLDNIVCCAHLSGDSQKVVVFWNEGTVRILDLQAGETILEQKYCKEGHTVEFSADSKKLLIYNRDGARVIDVKNGSPIATITPQHPGMLRSVHFSPDSLKVVSVMATENSKITNVATGDDLIRLVQEFARNN